MSGRPENLLPVTRFSFPIHRFRLDTVIGEVETRDPLRAFGSPLMAHGSPRILRSARWQDSAMKL